MTTDTPIDTFSPEFTATLDQAKIARIKAAIIAEMRRLKTGVTFIELQRAVGEEGSGKCAICAGSNPNIVFWMGMSPEFTEAHNQLHKEGFFETHQTQVLVYMVDGQVPDMPLATSNYKYKEPHWLPVTHSLARRPA